MSIALIIVAGCSLSALVMGICLVWALKTERKEW